jgi:hypothetical protein
VSEIAVGALPDEIPTFLRTPGAAQTIGELGRELDRSKGAGNPHDAERDPGHYVDLSDDGHLLSGPLLSAIPATRQGYDTELRRRTPPSTTPATCLTRSWTGGSSW